MLAAGLRRTFNPEVVVDGVDPVASPVPQVYPEAVSRLVGEEEQGVQPQPVFSGNITKAGPVLRPRSVEPLAAISSPLWKQTSEHVCVFTYLSQNM